MPYAKKIVVHCTDGYRMRLDALVEDFIRDCVVFVGVVGKDCSLVEDIIDELVVGDGTRDYHLLTSSHPDESVREVVQFAKSLALDLEGSEVEVVDL